MPLPTVKKLAGYAAIQTTLKHYYWFGDEDLPQAAETMLNVQAG